MAGIWMSRLGVWLLLMAAVVVIEPRLHLALEDRGDPRPRQFALQTEVMGQALGLVISWSQARRPIVG